MKQAKPEIRSPKGEDGSSDGGGAAREIAPDPEVSPVPRRRSFKNSYKLKILAEIDECSRGEVAAVLRRERLYSSHLSKWRLQQREGRLTAKTPRRGRKAADPAIKSVARLERENEGLRLKLEKAELIIDVQKKLSVVLGIALPPDPRRERSG